MRKMIMRNQVLVYLILVYIFDPNILNAKEKDNLFHRYGTILNLSKPEAIQHLNQYLLQ